MLTYDEFEHEINRSVVLERPLRPDISTRLVASLYLFSELTHGLFRYYSEDGSPCFPGKLLEEGEVYKVHQPEFEGSLTTSYRVSRLRLEEEFKEIIADAFEINPKTNLSKARLAIRYTKIDDERYQAEINFCCNTSDRGMLSIIKSVLGHVLLRIQRLATNPDVTLRELSLVNKLAILLVDKPAYSEFARGLTTQFVLDRHIRDVQTMIRNPAFLEHILPKTKSVSRHDEERLSVADICTIDFSNMSRTLESISEELNFKIAKLEDNELVLVSQKGILHFHQMDYRILLEEAGEEETRVSLSVSFSNSSLVSVGRFVYTATSFFTDKLPDPLLLLNFRARDLVTSSIRILNMYFRENFGVHMSSPGAVGTEVLGRVLSAGASVSAGAADSSGLMLK